VKDSPKGKHEAGGDHPKAQKVETGEERPRLRQGSGRRQCDRCLRMLGGARGKIEEGGGGVLTGKTSEREGGGKRGGVAAATARASASDMTTARTARRRQQRGRATPASATRQVGL